MKSLSRKDKKFSPLTSFQTPPQMSDKTRKAFEENEAILDQGQEDEKKGVAAVRKADEKAEATLLERKFREEQRMAGKRARKSSYRVALVTEAEDALARWRDELPQGYRWRVDLDDRGLLFQLKTPKGKIFARGMKICGDAKYDLNCVDRLVKKCVEFCDSDKGVVRMPDGTIRSKGGIILEA